MHVDLPINDPFSVKRVLNASTKSIHPDQPEWSAQTELGRKFLLLVDFSHIKESWLFRYKFIPFCCHYHTFWVYYFEIGIYYITTLVSNVIKPLQIFLSHTRVR